MTSLAPPPERDSWFAPLSIDLLARVLHVTILHPFVAALAPLCLRARAVRWDAPEMVGAIGWAVVVAVAWTAAAANRRLAYGPPRRVDLEDEVIVVTGGASGLGMLIAEVYGMRGATVAVLDVNEMENGEARGVTAYRCDVGDSQQVMATAKKIEQELGTPTVLINNAAIVVGKPLLDLSVDEIDRSLSTNLLGPFYCLKAFLPCMVRSPNGGTVVNVSSVIGQLGAARLSDYAAAKAGLCALHESLAAELRESHPGTVRMVLVTPGQLSTPLFRGVQTPSRFVAPVVETVEVAAAVVDAVDAGRAGRLAMPLYARWVAWYGVLPAGVQVLVRLVSGVDRGMRTFVGRGEGKKQR